MLSNTHFSLAVHVLSALAYNGGRVLGSEDLARTMGTNPSFLRGLIGELREAGLVETRLGKGGGATLARPAAAITLHDVYTAVESKPALTQHHCDASSPCPVARNMDALLVDLNDRLEGAVAAELGAITLEAIVSEHFRESP